MRKLLMIFALTCFVASGVAYGGLIGPSCPTCQGGTYDLTYSPTGTNNVFNLFLTVNTTSYTGGGSYISAVAPKPASSLLDFTLLSAPGGVGLWTTYMGGLNANGCSYAGSGFGCDESFPGASLTNPINMWSWSITVPDNSLLTGEDQASIKVMFTNSSGDKVGDLVSEGITMSQTNPVPESSTAVLLGIGVVAILLAFGKKKLLSV